MFYVIEPVAIGDANLVTTNVPENEQPLWEFGNSYARGSRVIMLSTHKVYQAVAPSSIGDVPTQLPPPSNLFHAQDNPDGKWIEVAATRRWKILDGKIGDYVQVGDNSVLSWTFRTGRADSVALFGLRATTVRVEVFDEDGRIIWDQAPSVIDLANITDGWDFFANPPAYHTEYVFRGVPIEQGSTVRVTVTHSEEPARVGEIVIGRETYVGRLLLGGGANFQDFSVNERDAFGNVVNIRRAYADIATYPVLVDAGRERHVLRTLAQLRNVPAVYHAGQDMTARGLTVFGLFRDVPFSLSSPTHSQLNIEILGVP